MMRQQFTVKVDGQIVFTGYNGKQAKNTFNEHDKKARRETGSHVLLMQDGQVVRDNKEIRHG